MWGRTVCEIEETESGFSSPPTQQLHIPGGGLKSPRQTWKSTNHSSHVYQDVGDESRCHDGRIHVLDRQAEIFPSTSHQICRLYSSVMVIMTLPLVMGVWRTSFQEMASHHRGVPSCCHPMMCYRKYIRFYSENDEDLAPVSILVII